jgi:sugar (pentulose or hexulose) kinase
MIAKFNTLIEKEYSWRLPDIFPKVLLAGEDAGALTAEGARLLDPSGNLEAGVPLCPPEGDAGTGMAATNAVRERTGNVSAGTSIFAMVVLEKALSKVWREIDIVTTPSGSPVAMAHCNNCTTDIDAWVKLFAEAQGLDGHALSKPALYDALYAKALEGDADCSGLVSYNYYSGEHMTGFDEGRPLFVRLPGSAFSLANFMRNLLYSSFATLKAGMDILTGSEGVKVENLRGHGGLFKTEGVAARLMAGALNIPVTVAAGAGEGGAWGIALLAAYRAGAIAGRPLPLADFLDKEVFGTAVSKTEQPDPKDAAGFAAWFKRWQKGLAVERAALQ